MPQAFWSASLFTSADVWHRRLSHPSSRVLSLLTSNKKIVCNSRHLNFQYQVCLLGKSSHMSLGLTGHKTFAPCELIFNDVWGPTFILSFDGTRYFVIFIDVHPKFIWFYLIIIKFAVFNVFHQFQVFIE